MKTQNQVSNKSITTQESEVSSKKEWNAPDINVIAPISRTAGGPDTGPQQEAGFYVLS